MASLRTSSGWQASILVVTTSWSRFGVPDGLFSADEMRHGIHGGAVETSIMLACHPERSEEHTSELQSRLHLVCRLLLEKKNKSKYKSDRHIESEDTCSEVRL